MSQDIGTARTHGHVGSGRLSGGVGSGFLRLVVDVRVEGELAEEFAGGGVDDADVEVLDEQDDVGSGVGSSDADVVEAAVVAQGDAAGGVDAVVSDAVVGVGVAAGAPATPWAGRCRGRCGVAWCGRERCGRLVVVDRRRRRRAGSAVSVVVCGWTGWARSHFFMVCWNRSTLPQVVGWLGREFFWTGPRAAPARSRGRCGRPGRRKRVVKTMPLSVSVEAGMPCSAAGVAERATTIGPVTRRWAVTDRRSGSSRRARSGSRCRHRASASWRAGSG
jgi:hypothetical protein